MLEHAGRPPDPGGRDECLPRKPYFDCRRSGETGRRAGLRIPWGSPPVRVRFPPPAPNPLIIQPPLASLGAKHRMAQPVFPSQPAVTWHAAAHAGLTRGCDWPRDRTHATCMGTHQSRGLVAKTVTSIVNPRSSISRADLTACAMSSPRSLVGFSLFCARPAVA